MAVRVSVYSLKLELEREESGRTSKRGMVHETIDMISLLLFAHFDAVSFICVSLTIALFISVCIVWDRVQLKSTHVKTQIKKHNDK